MSYCVIYLSVYYQEIGFRCIQSVFNKQDVPVSWYILTHFTSKVPYFECSVVAPCDHFRGLAEEFSSHYFTTVTRQCVL